jgi:hypothetical protein
MPFSVANIDSHFAQDGIAGAVRSSPAPIRTFAAQLKARALLAVFCRDEILEARMGPEVQEILGILARAVAAPPRRRHHHLAAGRSA